MAQEAFGRERASFEPAPRAIETAIWRKLPIPRKARQGDEIYDVRADPGMLSNRLGFGGDRESARRLDTLIDRLWDAYSRRALDLQNAGAETAEEQEALRSLGYVR